MGCGGSKRLEPEGEAIPERLRPLLRRRYEEIRNKSRGIRIAPKGWKATSTLSKKELLGKGNPSYEEIDVQMDDDRRSESSDEGNMKVAPIAEEGLDEGLLVKVKVSELSSPLSDNAEEKKVVDEIAVVSIPKVEGNDEKGCASHEHTRERSEDGKLKACLEPEEGNAEVQVPALARPASNVDEAELEEEILDVLPCLVLEGDDVAVETKELGQTFGFGFKPLLFPPASPSFRMYLSAPSIQGVGEVEDDENGNDVHSPCAVKEVETAKDSPINKESQIKEDVKDTEEQSKSSAESAESLHSDEAKKRWRRGLRFKGKLPKPRTTGMRNLFKAQSCYSSCSCGHSTTLLEEKSIDPKANLGRSN